MLTSAVLLAVATLLSGAYPAFVLSRFDPKTVLRAAQMPWRTLLPRVSHLKELIFCSKSAG